MGLSCVQKGRFAALDGAVFTPYVKHQMFKIKPDGA